MLNWIVGIVAAFAAGILGFWLARASAGARYAVLAEHNRQCREQLETLRGELAILRVESDARAGFETLAAERQRSLETLTAQLEATSRQVAEKGAEILRLTRENSRLQTSLTNESTNADRLTVQFKALAIDILKENSTTFTSQNKQSLEQLLNPLSAELKEFRSKVEAVKEESVVGRTQLTEHLNGLKALNQQLSKEAHDLATALRRDTKAQGNWGEIILLDLLENSGLRKGEQFTFQQSFAVEDPEENGNRRRQTDVVVKLPEGRHLIIDSKVSLNAYADTVNASTEEARKAAMKRHVLSLRGHAAELAGRNYTRLAGMESPDFVVMFVPIEPAFLLAMQEEDGLWLDAYQKGVLLAGPTTLLFVIRIVENLWQQKKQERNVKEVMDRGGELYDKFVGFVEDMKGIRESIRNASASCDGAMKKLSEGQGNLIRQVEMLKRLGAKSKKSLPRNLLDSSGIEEGALALDAGDEAAE